MGRLSDAEVREQLQSLPEWRREGDAIVREYRFADFVAAMRFVNRVAEAAEEAGHHPDIDIRYNKVRLLLTTHDSGGLTDRDIRLARTIRDLPTA